MYGTGHHNTLTWSSWGQVPALGHASSAAPQPHSHGEDWAIGDVIVTTICALYVFWPSFFLQSTQALPRTQTLPQVSKLD